MISEHKFIKLTDGTELHSEIKEKGQNIWLIAVHGIGEHLGRHSYINELFGHDFNICQFDLRGHGRSFGDRGYIEEFSQYVKDLKEIIYFLKEHYQMKRYVLFGHSMGALISASFIQSYVEDEIYPERLFLNAPPIGFGGILGQVIRLTPREFFKGLVKIPVSIELKGLVDMNNFSHDPQVKEEVLNDEYNCVKLHSKLLLELVKTSKDVFSRPLRPKCPSFCTIGSEDKIADPGQARIYFETLEKAVSFQVIDGAFHEVHNEVKRYRLPYFEYLKNSINSVLYENKSE